MKIEDLKAKLGKTEISAKSITVEPWVTFSTVILILLGLAYIVMM